MKVIFVEAILNFVEAILGFVEAILNLVKTKSTPRFDLEWSLAIAPVSDCIYKLYIKLLEHSQHKVFCKLF